MFGTVACSGIWAPSLILQPRPVEVPVPYRQGGDATEKENVTPDPCHKSCNDKHPAVEGIGRLKEISPAQFHAASMQ